MEWNSLQKIVSDDCKLRIDFIGRGIFNPDIYELMGREKTITEMLSGDRSGICYIAPSGAGKTSLFCKLADQWSKENLVFLTGLQFPLSSETALFDYISGYFTEHYSIDLNGQVDEFVAFLVSNKKKCIIMIDGIDECVNLEMMKMAIHYAIVRFARGPIKFVMNCRNIIWKVIHNYTWLNTLQLVQWQPEDDVSLFRDPHFNVVLRSYFDKYQVSGTPIEKSREMCRYPISLRLFCEANRGKQLNETDPLRYMDMYIRYIANVANTLLKIFPQQDQKSIVTIFETVSLCFWQNSNYCLSKELVVASVNEMAPADSSKMYQAMVHLHFLRETSIPSGTFVTFGHQLILEYLIANAFSKQKQWIVQPKEAITNDLVEIVNNQKDNQLLFPVLEFVFPVLEIIGKHHVMISLFMKKEQTNGFKLMLCRAATRMGQVDIETWQMLRQLESTADPELKLEVAYVVYLLGENIPGDQVFHSLILIQSKDDAVLQRNISARIKFDSNFSSFIKQIQPYCRIPDVQNGIVEFVKRIRDYPAPTYRLPLLNLTDLVISFNADEGLENLTLIGEHTKDDPAFLDAWVNVACNHAEKLFLKLIRTYITIVKNDRLKWERIFRFCLAGGHKDPATALKLMLQGFESVSNYSLMLSTMSFVGQYGDAEPESASLFISQALKKAKFLPSLKQMELREKTAETALSCFIKNNRAFAKVISELSASEDLKIKEQISSELQKWRKTQPL
jgi:hypothetical protein